MHKLIDKISLMKIYKSSVEIQCVYTLSPPEDGCA